MNHARRLLVLVPILLTTCSAVAQHTTLNVSVYQPTGPISDSDVVFLFARTPVNVFGSAAVTFVNHTFGLVPATHTINWSYTTVLGITVLPIPSPVPAIDVINLGPLASGTYNVNVSWTDASGLASPFTTGNGTMEFVVEDDPTELPGDHNGNGIVDAADYTLWRDKLGSGTSLGNDHSPGVGPDDYERWKANFGHSASGAGGSSTTVPEPSSFVFCVGALIAQCAVRRRK